MRRMKNEEDRERRKTKSGTHDEIPEHGAQSTREADCLLGGQSAGEKLEPVRSSWQTSGGDRECHRRQRKWT